MKKTLLIAVAALASGIISSQAQPVYSANIVGYVNSTTIAGKYVLVSNPLDNGTNTLNDLVPSAATGSSVQVWNGSIFSGSTKTPAGWNPNAAIPVGKGFFLRTALVITNTFVGNVVTAPGTSVTNTLPGGVYSLVGSAVPYADNLAGTNLNLTPGTGSSVQTWNGTTYTGSTKTPTSWAPNSAISVGQGFFVRPSTTYNWIQNLPANN